MRKTKEAVKEEKMSKETPTPAPKRRVAKVLDSVESKIVDSEGEENVPLLSRQYGRSSGPSYVIAAVKAEKGIISIRDRENGDFKVKFFPSLSYWGINFETLKEFGVKSGVAERGSYQRFIMSASTIQNLLNYVDTMVQAKARQKKRKTLENRIESAPFRVVKSKFHDGSVQSE